MNRHLSRDCPCVCNVVSTLRFIVDWFYRRLALVTIAITACDSDLHIILPDKCFNAYFLQCIKINYLFSSFFVYREFLRQRGNFSVFKRTCVSTSDWKDRANCRIPRLWVIWHPLIKICRFSADFLLIGVIMLSFRCKMNPDNLATPLAASFGDVVSIGVLSGISSQLYLRLDTQIWVLYVILVVYLLLLPCWIMIVLKNKYTRKVLKTGWVPVLSALFISG